MYAYETSEGLQRLRDQTNNRVTFLQHLVNSDQCLKSLYFVGQYWLYSESTPKRYRGMVIPCKHNALYVKSESADDKTKVRHTSDMFLFWSCLFRACRLLDIHNKLLLSLVLVHRSSWIVDLALVVECILARSASCKPRVEEERYCEFQQHTFN